MSPLDACATTAAGVAFAAWCLSVARRRRGAPQDGIPPPLVDPAQRWRHVIAWEVRGLVLVLAGPLAGAMLAGYAPQRYAVPLVMGSIAGMLLAEIIAPWSVQRG